ncbi:Alpha/beta hydrolase family-domain-containing protein [Aspergillus carlsbadensis]|nr:Alpha/beta hydrolase family-domain-containing protein [Aspergillus carlsbadensis]
MAQPDPSPQPSGPGFEPEPIISMIPIGTQSQSHSEPHSHSESHSLWTSISGPATAQGQGQDQGQNPLSLSRKSPLIVIIAGAGDVAASYVALERLLRPFASVFLYDRTGLGRSECPPEGTGYKPNAVRAAEELHALLSALAIAPKTKENESETECECEAGPESSPQTYILVAHSYGGIIAREFLHLYSTRVAGLVLVDCATERSSELLTFPDPNIAAVMRDLNFARVTGLRGDTVLSDEEWRVRARDIRAGAAMAGAEAKSFVEVCETLRDKNQVTNQALGERPLVVIRANGVRDYERVYEAGLAAGYGSSEEQRAFRELLDRWEGIDREVQEGQLGLSSVSRLVRIQDCGHNVHLVRPDVVVEGVRWVLERIAGGDAVGER